jgi:tRNA threonylcarbamoyladenosine biosynthesis protein TsaB
VYATGKKLVLVPTLEAFAWNVTHAPHPVCTLLDARKKEVYAGIFRWNGGGFDRVLPEQALPITLLLENIASPTIFLGEGALLYRDAIVAHLGEQALFGSPQHMVPSPANVALLATLAAERGEFADAIASVPRYYRRSEAEITNRP